MVTKTTDISLFYKKRIEDIFPIKDRIIRLEKVSSKLDLTMPVLAYPSFVYLLFVIIFLSLLVFGLLFLFKNNVLLFAFPLKFIVVFLTTFSGIILLIICTIFPRKNFDEIYTYKDFVIEIQRINSTFMTKNEESLREHINDIFDYYEEKLS